MLQAPAQSPVDEYERRFSERRREAEAATGRWAGRFWLAHFVIPLAVCAAALMTRVWMTAFDLDRTGSWLVGALAGVIVFASLAYSLAATCLSAVATVRGWLSLRNRFRLFGLTPWLVVSTEALLVLAAMLG
jgi:hypothetical protein